MLRFTTGLDFISCKRTFVKNLHRFAPRFICKIPVINPVLVNERLLRYMNLNVTERFPETFYASLYY